MIPGPPDTAGSMTLKTVAVPTISARAHPSSTLAAITHPSPTIKIISKG